MHHSTLRRFRHRFAIPALLALAAAFGVASAQEAGITDMTELLNATTVTFHDGLPADDGQALFDSTAAEIPNDDAVLETTHVEIAYGDRSYLFDVAGVVAGKEVRLDVAGDLGPATDAEPRPNLEEVIEWLDVAIDGGRDVLITSRREGDVNVVTGIYDLENRDAARAASAEAGSRVALLSGGASTIHTVASAGETLGDVTVESDGGEAPLLGEGGAWHGLDDTATADGESEAAAGADEPALGGGGDAVEGTAQGAEGGAAEDADGAAEDAAAEGADAEGAAAEGAAAEGAAAAEAAAGQGLEPGLGLPLDR